MIWCFIFQDSYTDQRPESSLMFSLNLNLLFLDATHAEGKLIPSSRATGIIQTKGLEKVTDVLEAWQEWLRTS